MRILVTGAAGHIGRRLTAALLARGELLDADGAASSIDYVAAVDIRAPAALPAKNPRHEFVVGDLADPDVTKSLVDKRIDSVFHVATATSGDAERDFALGMRANIDATRNLLDAIRATGYAPRFVYASSLAVMGATPADEIGPQSALRPISSYGAQKAICELLVNEYSRRGYIDGCAVRIPTIFVRPDRSSSQATDFASDMVRQVLAGREMVCSADPSMKLLVMSPRRVTEALIEAHDARNGARRLQGQHTLPGLVVSAADILGALARIVGPERTSKVRFVPASSREVMPADEALPVAHFARDESLDAIIREHIANLDGQ